MNRTQVQLPDHLYREAKRIAAEREMTMAEVIRRGLEHMVRLYPRRDTAEWRAPTPHRLGIFRAPVREWREWANAAAEPR